MIRLFSSYMISPKTINNQILLQLMELSYFWRTIHIPKSLRQEYFKQNQQKSICIELVTIVVGWTLK